MTDTIKAYKGFDKNWQCRGFQYKVGETYTHDGEVSLCNSGFHACESPLNIWDFYPAIDGNVAAKVELGGVTKETQNDTKRVGKTITIKAALTIPMLIAAQIEWTFKAAGKGEKTKKDEAVNAASGDSSKLAASGHSSQLAASGHYSQLAASGDYSKLAASGHSSKLAASGHSSQLAASGDYSKLAASGHSSKLAADGKASVAMASGPSSRAKAGPDGAIALAWWNDKQKRYRIAVGYVGEDIDADTWYEVVNGKLKKVAA